MALTTDQDIAIISSGVLGFLAIMGLFYARRSTLLAQEEAERNRKASKLKDGQSHDSLLPGNADSMLSSLDFDEMKYRRYIKDETEYIDIRGIASGDPSSTDTVSIPIDKIYADLFVKPVLTERETDIQSENAPPKVNLIEFSRVTRCVVITGDPGSGKTTFLRHLAYKLVAEYGVRWPCGESVFRSGKFDDGEDGDSQTVLPILISLADFYTFINPTSQKAYDYDLIPGFVATEDLLVDYFISAAQKLKIQAARPGVERLLRAGRVIWLLDGMDEIASSEVRRKLAEIIHGSSRIWSNCRFIVTSRPRAVVGLSMPRGFDVASIDVLQDEEIKCFLGGWTTCLYTGKSVLHREEYFNRLISVILEGDNPHLKVLAQNPVMLTCMAVLHYNRKQLPNSKADLLEAIIQWLIFSRHKDISGHQSSPTFTEARLRELAYAMLNQTEGNRYQVGILWASDNIKSHFQGDIKDATSFLEQERHLSGIIVVRGEGELAFWHSWFLQYLAAKEIAGATDDAWWTLIEPHLDQADWQEVLCLVPACLRRMGNARVNLFFDRLVNNTATAELPIKIQRFGLVGIILQDLLSTGYFVNIHNWEEGWREIEKVFHENLSHIPLVQRFNAAAALGIIGDSRLKNITDRWVHVPRGRMHMGAQNENPDELNYDTLALAYEGPVCELEVESFDIAKYLTTSMDYAEFYNAGGYSSKGFWTNEGWLWKLQNNILKPLVLDEQLRQPNSPVVGVSWFEAKAYCNWLSTNSQYANYTYRLPTETEWEFCAKAHIPAGSRFMWGNKLSKGDKAEANWINCYLRCKTPVGMFPISTTSNGIADLIGNVEEWCEDVWSVKQFDTTGSFATVTAPDGIKRVVRGGSTIRPMRLCRPTYRSQTLQTNRYRTIGFRVVRIPMVG